LDYILGVDGGATKTVIRAKTTSNDSFIEMISGSSNYKSDGLNKARKNIISGIKNIVEKIRSDFDPEFNCFLSACFGLSGYDFENDKTVYNNIIFSCEIGCYFNPSKTIICNDTKIGLAAGSDKNDCVIFISGTGSNCYGRNSLGLEAKASGWDFVLGDQGSGYEIGIKALRALMKAYDGRGPDTLLKSTILSSLKIENISDLLQWVYCKPFSKNKISSIAKIVHKTVEMGDMESLRILNEEIDEIISAISTIADKLDLNNKDFDLVLMGSVFKNKKYFTDIIIDKIKSKYKKANVIYLLKPPVEGALKLALENA
jgi:N-acetylglucosamine kinase-like BadF-type ATPase